MNPKKNNRHIWRITKYFVDHSDSLKFVNPGYIGAEIIHLQTKERGIYKKEFIDKLHELNLLEYEYYGIDIPITQIVGSHFFDGVIHDESILEPYIDRRPTWDEYFMANARLISARSTCDRLYVGCVLVRNNHIIATGYNGSIAGHPHCDEIGHLEVEENGKIGCKRTIHAEKNVLNMCAKLGISTKGATAYVTHYPCPDCMRELNQAGIKEVIYGNFYQHRYPNNFHIGMELREFKGKHATIQWEE
jgi:dCMP deaminase